MERTLWRKIYDRYITMYTDKMEFPNWAKHFISWYMGWEIQKNIMVWYKWQLKDYQVEALMHVVENEWWLIEAPTWSWKSHIVMWITDYFKTKTLVVCPTKKLVKEMVDKFTEFTDIEPWTWYSDWKKIKDVTITTHTSFVKDILWEWKLNWFGLILVDEADDKLSEKMIHAIAKSWCDILVGMTWTPSRQELDTNDMQLIFWPHISVGKYQVMPTSITHYVYKRWQDESASIDYTNRHTQRESIIWNKYRFENVLDTIKKIQSESFLTILLLDRLEEVEKYREEFPDAIVITWSTKIKDDEIWIEKLKKTWWLIIWSIKKLYRWVDIPVCDSVIIASPIKFENTVIQAVWRALRSHEDKKNVTISIINDNVLQRQRYEQSKACKEAYWFNPEIVYI